MSRFRWSLRTMLALTACLCALFGYQGYVDRQITGAVDGLNRMMGMGTANFPDVGLDRATFTVVNASATDADLDAFAAAFNGYLPHGAPQFIMLDLNGSPVSAQAIARFNAVAPSCKVVP